MITAEKLPDDNEMSAIEICETLCCLERSSCKSKCCDDLSLRNKYGSPPYFINVEE